jgi:DNA-binding CsgD family transcriptional regulator
MFEQGGNRFVAFEYKVQPGIIHDFYMDRNNVLWIAGINGLFKLDSEQKKVVNSDYYQDKNIPYAIRRILPLMNGNLLLATTNNGLMEYSRSNNLFINLISNAAIGSINDMKFDSSSTIWMTSSNGLFSYDYKTKEILDHAYCQGIQRSEYSCLFLLRNGNFTVGWGGVTFIDPYYKMQCNYRPPVVFTALSVMDRTIEPGDSLHNRIILPKSITYANEFELRYAENIFTVSFASLDYANLRRIEYRYKLEGFDNDWHHIDDEKAFATYTNLDAGKYTFIVEATNAEKQWSTASTATIAITIVPPFWQTLWFKFICMLVVFWVIFSMYRQKLAEKQKEFEHIRNEILQTEISNKEKILAAKNSELTSSVVHISNKNEILQEIRRGLKAIQQDTNIENVKRIITKINNQVDQNLSTDDHWEQFEIHFNQIHDNFLEKLKKEYPELTQNNLRFCAYLRMNLSSKEIALLMNISPDAVLKSKYRLKIKLHLSNEQDLIEFILAK